LPVEELGPDGGRIFLRRTIGSGYRPALALPHLVGLFAIGWVVFDLAYPTELRPAKSGAEQPRFNPARYTPDLQLPVANFHRREAFILVSNPSSDRGRSSARFSQAGDATVGPA
jgi:hypothetical protein